MSKSLRSKLIRVNSKERDLLLSTSSSKMVINFNSNDPNLSQVHSIALKSASIPNSQYNILAPNNVFTFETLAVPFSITLTEGNYTISTLIAALIADAVAIAVGMAIIVDPITGRLQFTFTTNSQLLTIDEGNAMGNILGIRVGSLVDVASFLADSLPNLIGLENIYIACTELSGGDYLIDALLGQLNIFAHIPVDVSFGRIQHYATSDEESDLIDFPSDRTLDSLSITLYNDRGQNIDLSGLDWQMILKVYFHTNSNH